MCQKRRCLTWQTFVFYGLDLPICKVGFLVSSTAPYVCMWQALKLLYAHICSIFGTVVTNVNRFVWNSVYFNYVTRDTHWQWLVMKDGYEERQCVVLYLFIQVVSCTPYPRDLHKLDIRKMDTDCKVPQKFSWAKPGSKLHFGEKMVSSVCVLCVSSVQRAGDGCTQVSDARSQSGENH